MRTAAKVLVFGLAAANCLCLVLATVWAASIGNWMWVATGLFVLLTGFASVFLLPEDLYPRCVGGVLGQIVCWILGVVYFDSRSWRGFVQGHWDPTPLLVLALAGILGFIVGVLVARVAMVLRRKPKAPQGWPEGE